MMTDFYALVSSFAAGAGIGAFYLGSLWLTAHYIPRTEHPHLLMATSLVGRIGLTLVALYLVANGQWQRLLACFLGFFMLRAVLMHWQVRKMEVS
jgi:F1F0 ATPase subunit 2